jgi:hypothetical protein
MADLSIIMQNYVKSYFSTLKTLELFTRSCKFHLRDFPKEIRYGLMSLAINQ